MATNTPPNQEHPAMIRLLIATTTFVLLLAWPCPVF